MRIFVPPKTSKLFMEYLDPRADLTFKKVFGEHLDLVKSLLNALLPFETEADEIVDLEYLPAELVPETPFKKNSIVDVRCKDGRGRQFIVEMQMVWSQEFKQRVLFNAAKAYVRQLGDGEDYKLLQPVYALNLVNEEFEAGMEGYYHYYRMVHSERTDKVIDGLHLVFVELPKFTPRTFSEKKMHVLWLRYLTEINDRTHEVPEELMANPEIRKAVEELRRSAFTPAQLYSYEQFWDAVSVERTLVNNVERKYKEGWQEGMEEGMEKGLEKGRAEGERKKSLEIARKLLASGLPEEFIAGSTGLTINEIQNSKS